MKVGIVGNGSIVVQALQCFREAGIACTALWCRTREKGEAIFEGPVYTDYAAFLKQTTFDVVYIGLINSLHYAYALEALKNGKHVIVEKPFTVTLQETKELIELAEENHLYLFEAILSRYNPVYGKLKDYVSETGNLKLIQSNYSQYSRRYDAYKEGKVLPAFDPALYGGALYDLNVYNIHLVAGLFGKPEEVRYFANIGFNGVDTSGTLILKYPTFLAVCTAAKDSRSPSGTVFQGDEKTLSIHSRPGFVQNVFLEDTRLDEDTSVHPMTQEFLSIQNVLDTEKYAQMKKWLSVTRIVMEILEEARPY